MFPHKLRDSQSVNLALGTSRSASRAFHVSPALPPPTATPITLSRPLQLRSLSNFPVHPHSLPAPPTLFPPHCHFSPPCQPLRASKNSQKSNKSPYQMIRRAFSRNPIPYIDAIAMQGLGVSMLHKSWHLRRANAHTFCYIIDKSTAEQPPYANETVLHVFCTLSSPSRAADFPINYFFFTWFA